MAEQDQTIDSVRKPVWPIWVVGALVVLAGAWFMVARLAPDSRAGLTGPSSAVSEQPSDSDQATASTEPAVTNELATTTGIEEGLALGAPAGTMISIHDWEANAGILVDLSDGSLVRLSETRIQLVAKDWVVGTLEEPTSSGSATMVVFDRRTGVATTHSTGTPNLWPGTMAAAQEADQIWIIYHEDRGMRLERVRLPSFEVLERIDLEDFGRLWGRSNGIPLLSTEASGVYELSSAGLLAFGPGVVVTVDGSFVLTLECDDQMECFLVADGVRLLPAPASLAQQASYYRTAIPATRDWLLYPASDRGTVRVDLASGEESPVELHLDEWSNAVTLNGSHFVIGDGGIVMINPDGRGGTSLSVLGFRAGELGPSWSPEAADG